MFYIEQTAAGAGGNVMSIDATKDYISTYVESQIEAYAPATIALAAPTQLPTAAGKSVGDIVCTTSAIYIAVATNAWVTATLTAHTIA